MHLPHSVWSIMIKITALVRPTNAVQILIYRSVGSSSVIARSEATRQSAFLCIIKENGFPRSLRSLGMTRVILHFAFCILHFLQGERIATVAALPRNDTEIFTCCIECGLIVNCQLSIVNYLSLLRSDKYEFEFCS